jgi:hypothetical protein
VGEKPGAAPGPEAGPSNGGSEKKMGDVIDAEFEEAN